MLESKLIFIEIHKRNKILSYFRNIQEHLVIIRAEIQLFSLLPWKYLKLWFNKTKMFHKVPSPWILFDQFWKKIACKSAVLKNRKSYSYSSISIVKKIGNRQMGKRTICTSLNPNTEDLSSVNTMICEQV